jgi:hypothetical protein
MHHLCTHDWGGLFIKEFRIDCFELHYVYWNGTLYFLYSVPVLQTQNRERSHISWQILICLSGNSVTTAPSSKMKYFSFHILAPSKNPRIQAICGAFQVSFLASFPYFEKIKGGLWDHLAAFVSVCLSVYLALIFSFYVWSESSKESRWLLIFRFKPK